MITNIRYMFSPLWRWNNISEISKREKFHSFRQYCGNELQASNRCLYMGQSLICYSFFSKENCIFHLEGKLIQSISTRNFSSVIWRLFLQLNLNPPSKLSTLNFLKQTNIFDLRARKVFQQIFFEMTHGS